MNTKNYLSQFLEDVRRKNSSQKVFLQAVEEVVQTLTPVLEQKPLYIKEKILERIVEPERMISFRVPWRDDKGEIHVNRGYRVQFNSALGPYKGGIRFHSSVTEDSLKFLAFEQTFKNSLTTLPLGGGKGGSDFDTRGKSDNEVTSFTTISAIIPTCPPATWAAARARLATCLASTKNSPTILHVCSPAKNPTGAAASYARKLPDTAWDILHKICSPRAGMILKAKSA